MREYIEYITNELNHYKDMYDDIETIFIGGGTPNALPLDLLEKLFIAIKNFSEKQNIKEYSIECNPELINQNQVSLFTKYKINRVSLGAESFNDDILKKLGRHHKKDDIIKSVNILKDNGIYNINVDLIFAHPYDTMALVKENLNEFYSLKIPHISYYSMILEDKTVFKYLYDRNKIELPDEDTQADMYEYIIQDLSNHEFKQYEISNFSKDGFESIHNKLYWQDKEYIGIGLGASGYLDSRRYTNSFKFDDYYKNKLEYEEILSKEDSCKEFMMMGFRMIEGPSKVEFFNRFNVSINEMFKIELEKLINEDLIVETKTNYKLTHKGLMLANLVFMEFA